MWHSSFFLRKELSSISAKDAGTLQERKPGRGSDGSKPYQFPDLFHLWTYAGTVYLLYAHGKWVSDFKRLHAVPYDDGGVASFPRRNLMN